MGIFKRIARRFRKRRGRESSSLDDRLEPIADFVGSLAFEELPEDVRETACRVIPEGLSWMFWGARSSEGRVVSSMAERWSAGRQEATLVGSRKKIDRLSAAFANAALSQVHDGNDGHVLAGKENLAYHPGRVVLPAALATAEAESLSGRDLILLVVLGYEIASRIRWRQHGAPVYAYAAAAVAARGSGLDRDEARFALKIAGFHQPRTGIHDFETNGLTNAWIARAGLEAVELVRSGYPASLSLAHNRASSLEFRGDRETWETRQIYVKPYPTCRATHGAIDAVLTLRAQVQDRIQDIAKVTAYVRPEEMFLARHDPPGAYYKSREIGLPWVLTCAILDGEIGADQLSVDRLRAHDASGLQQRIDVQARRDLSDHPCAAHVEIAMADGTVHSKTVMDPKGSPSNSLSDDDLRRKFLRWAGPSLRPGAAEAILDAARSLPEQEDLSGFFELLRSGGV